MHVLKNGLDHSEYKFNKNSTDISVKYVGFSLQFRIRPGQNVRIRIHNTDRTYTHKT